MANRDKIEKLDELIKDSIEGKLVEQTVTSLLPPGENYGSVMYKVDFKVEKDGEEIEYNAVAKCTPLNQITQEVFNTQETFKSEIAWYTIVIPTLKKFANDQGMERELDFFQNFYGARISLDPKSDVVDLDGVILTQNLKNLGYYNIDRHAGFDAPTTRGILRDLATFHAVPLAIRLKDPKLFETNLKPYCPKFGDITKEMKEDMDQGVIQILEQIPEVEIYMDRLKKAIRNHIPFAEKETREPWTTIIHMDFWCNNIMVTGGKNSKTMMLDFQLPMTGSLVCDVVFFLLTSVNLQVVNERFDEFLKYYYEELIKNLKELKIDTEKFDYDGFLNEIQLELAEFIHSFYHCQIILADKGITQFDASDANFHEKMKDMENFKKNIKIIPNKRQIEKFRWLSLQGAKRNWF